MFKIICFIFYCKREKACFQPMTFNKKKKIYSYILYLTTKVREGSCHQVQRWKVRIFKWSVSICPKTKGGTPRSVFGAVSTFTSLKGFVSSTIIPDHLASAVTDGRNKHRYGLMKFFRSCKRKCDALFIFRQYLGIDN